MFCKCHDNCEYHCQDDVTVFQHFITQNPDPHIILFTKENPCYIGDHTNDSTCQHFNDQQYVIADGKYRHALFSDLIDNDRIKTKCLDKIRCHENKHRHTRNNGFPKNPKVLCLQPDKTYIPFIEGNNTEKCDTASAAFQSENNGCVDFVGSEDEIMEQIRQLVCMLPSNNEGDVYTDDCEDDLNRACESMENMKGDPRYLLSQISDYNTFFETKADYAKNMVTGLIKLNGMTVGAVANCSEVYDAEGKKAESFDKSLTAQGCNKAAEFVQFCDAFSIPVLTITNVNGLKNCMCSEKKLAKALARMTYAFSNATCAKVNLITGEAYGSAYVFMNSKSVGADLVYAWSGAKIGAMDSTLAAKIMYPEAGADEIKQKAADYEKLQDSAASAAARGYVDRLIDPADTRKYLVAAFEMLYTKYVSEPEKKHGTK